MAKFFEQFHFSLIEREQIGLFEEQLTRELWLRKVLRGRFQFRHAGKDFYWVPQDLSDEFIVGVVERQKSQLQRTPPDQGAREIQASIWTGSMVIIDPVHRPDGQKVAFESNSAVGQPKALLSSMVSHLNAGQTHQYVLYFKPLFNGDSFWKFASKFDGSLEYVNFKFTVPNMLFGVGSKVTDGLKRIGSDTGAQEVEVRLDSKDGVETNSETVKEAVEYAEDGNARVTAKSLTGEYWSSTSRQVTVKMHSVLNFATVAKAEVQGWLKEALGRDKDSDNPGFDNPDNWDRDA